MSSPSLTIMDRDPAHFPEFYSSLFSPMVEGGHHMQSDDIENNMCYPCGFGLATFPDMPLDYPHPVHFHNPSYAQNTGNLSTPQRQQPNPLYIDTQVKSYHNDLDSSTASSSSLSTLLRTPCHGHPSMTPAIHIPSPSPRSAPADSGILIPDFFENKSPIASSPSSYNPSYIKLGGSDHLSALLLTSDVETQVLMPHILEWKSVAENSGRIDFIPQTVYQPYTEADRKRYIREVMLQPTIFFHSDDPSAMGISLDDALRQRLKDLKDKDERMFVNCGPSVSIRIQWPGYQSWSKQIPTKDFRNPKGHITRAKLAKNIATCIKHFIEDSQDKLMEAGSDKRWKVGEWHIKVEDLILVSLHHVSKGSWQPQLRLRSAPSPY